MRKADLAKTAKVVSSLLSPILIILTGTYALNVISADKLPYAFLMGAAAWVASGSRQDKRSEQEAEMRNEARLERIERTRMETKADIATNQSPINQLMPHIIDNLPLIISVIANKKGVDPSVLQAAAAANGLDLEALAKQNQ
jgi:hypothetical protein